MDNQSRAYDPTRGNGTWALRGVAPLLVAAYARVSLTVLDMPTLVSVWLRVAFGRRADLTTRLMLVEVGRIHLSGGLVPTGLLKR